jgi:hypothetical protein
MNPTPSDPALSDPLADRVASWAAEIAANPGDDQLKLQGWALREATRRRGQSAQHLAETIEPHLSPLPASLISNQIKNAISAFEQFLADLDSAQTDHDHIRQQARDVFFEVLEALILAEDAAGDEETLQAQKLFNATINDLYVFESMADVAAEQKGVISHFQTPDSAGDNTPSSPDEQKGVISHFQTPNSAGDNTPSSPVELSHLFCAAIAGLYDGQIRVRPQPQSEAEEFIPLSAVIRSRPSTKPLTPAALGKRLARIPFWYVQWAAQRLTLAFIPKSTDLHVYVWNGEDPATLALSQDLNGWQLRICHNKEISAATIANATAQLKLPRQIDPANFTVEIKAASSPDWIELFGRVEQQS